MMKDTTERIELHEAVMRSVLRTRRRLWITCVMAMAMWMLLAAFV